MRRKLLAVSLTASLTALLCAVQARAEDREYVEASVPFQFQVGSTTLPPGSYVIEKMGQDAMQVRAEKGDLSADFLTDSAFNRDPSQDTHLTFERIGDQNFLSQVWVEGQTLGTQVVKPRAELQLEKQFHSGLHQTTSIAARHVTERQQAAKSH